MKTGKRKCMGPSTAPVIGINMDAAEARGRPVVQIFSAYVDAVHDAGGIPLLVPCTTDRRLLERYVGWAHGFLLIGGKDYSPRLYGARRHVKTQPMDKRRAACDLLLGAMLLERDVPCLAICAGHQLLGVLQGGKLIQHIENADEHAEGSYHRIRVVPDTRLASVLGRRTATVNSSHHQAIDPAAVGAGLQVSAWAEDGTIEAVEAVRSRFLLGVQWHPERIKYLAHRRRVFAALIKAARDNALCNHGDEHSRHRGS